MSITWKRARRAASHTNDQSSAAAGVSGEGVLPLEGANVDRQRRAVLQAPVPRGASMLGLGAIGVEMDDLHHITLRDQGREVVEGEDEAAIEDLVDRALTLLRRQPRVDRHAAQRPTEAHRRLDPLGDLA